MIFISIIGQLYLFEYMNSLKVPLNNRNITPAFQDLLQENWSFQKGIGQLKYNYPQRQFFVLLPDNFQNDNEQDQQILIKSRIPIENQKHYLNVIFTGSHQSQKNNVNIFQDILFDKSFSQDSIFYQVHRNESHTTLIGKNSDNWEKSFIDLIYKKQFVKSRDLSLLNTCAEALENKDLKGLIIFDLRGVRDYKATLTLYKQFQEQKEKYVMLQYQSKDKFKLFQSFKVDNAFTSEIMLEDINAVLHALIGVGINQNNMGLTSYQYLKHQLDKNLISYNQINNIFNLQRMYHQIIAKSYLSDANMLKYQQQIVTKYKIIVEFFDLHMNDAVRNRQPQDPQNYEAFSTLCKDLLNELYDVITINHNMHNKSYIYTYIVIQVLASIIMILLLLKSVLFIVENYNERNTSASYQILGIVVVFALAIFVFSIEFNLYLIVLMILAVIAAAFALYQIFKGKIEINNIKQLDYIDIQILIIINIWNVILSFDSDLKQAITLLIVSLIIAQSLRKLRGVSQLSLKFFILSIISIVAGYSVNNNILESFISSNSIQELSESNLLRVYIPTAIFIMVEQFIYSSDKIMFLVDNTIFINLLRGKSILSYILIPRLWAGEQSRLFKSFLFSFYQFSFFGIIIAVFIFITYESVFKYLSGTYNSLINEKELRKDMTDDISYSKFYLHKQIKFEIFLISFLNILPLVILISGPGFYLQLIGILTIVITLMAMEIKINPYFHHSFITKLLLVGLLFKLNDNNETTKQLYEYEIVVSNQIIAGLLATFKQSAVEIVIFSLFCLYTLKVKNHRQVETKITEALEFDRYYENEEDIQAQILNNEIINKLTCYFLCLSSVYLVQIIIENLIFNSDQTKSIQAQREYFSIVELNSVLVIMAVFMLH
ncbi:UNKNOWN [Stylonychia lemnae]|uniref:Transmembrane protein n=1 Tax=Stylonychia lemnae TaxID=5949 RepID=A0A077ZSL9_STYLE|nr:UNKNOWN [Stylonychia lemnae]|eukprot:CDW72878.1 UNKNOWN [Stylonychia lemnae]